MKLIEEIDFLLNYLPSQIIENNDLKSRLMVVMAKLGQPISRGCSDCYNRAYFRIMKMKQNNYIVENSGSTYLFRKDLHGYRSKKTGKVMRNNNTTWQERKEVFDTSPSHRSLFQVESIPLKKEVEKTVVKPIPPKSRIIKEGEIQKRKRTSKKKESSITLTD